LEPEAQFVRRFPFFGENEIFRRRVASKHPVVLAMTMEEFQPTAKDEYAMEAKDSFEKGPLIEDDI
jgi:hypothetical protein